MYINNCSITINVYIVKTSNITIILYIFAWVNPYYTFNIDI